ncbi:MAG: hypothetical protein D6743_12545 [Calditrichaeota bacterium]|nr:MAG: hypothetical protein D6743_12545 [Calditrichota bacterium]
MFIHTYWTKRLLTAGTVCLLLCCSSVGLSRAQAKRQNDLAKIAQSFLGKWVGKGNLPSGETFVSELIFEWTLNKNFIKVTNNVSAGQHSGLFATTFYGWQPVLQQVVFWSFDSEGTINEGAARFEGNELKHEWRSFGQNGEIRDWRSTLAKNDANTLTFTVTESGSQPVTVVYKRKK